MNGSGITARLRTMYEFRVWRSGNYTVPIPRAVQEACLLRHGVSGATWVETGTFKGETTAFLAQSSKFVYSIEPEPTLAGNAQKLFAKSPNVKIIEGTSETVFPQLLPTLSGDINFWLDGHYSAGITFKGPLDTPIIEELKSIRLCLKNFGNVSILIDDVRLFYSQAKEYEGYPPLDFLVSWCQKNDFRWTIENDIFIAKNH